MIVISAALPKSASTLMCNYQRDFLLAGKRGSAQSEFQRANGGRFIEKVGFSKMLRLVFWNFRLGSFVFKTYCAADITLRVLIRLGLAKATYCFRDPRDVVLSALDHADRSRRGLDPAKALITLQNVQDTVPQISKFLRSYYSWKKTGYVHFFATKNSFKTLRAP
jgi:hypothetical protein